MGIYQSPVWCVVNNVFHVPCCLFTWVTEFSFISSHCKFLRLFPVLLQSFSRHSCFVWVPKLFYVCFSLAILMFQVLPSGLWLILSRFVGKVRDTDLIPFFFLHVDMQFSQHYLRAVFSFFSNKSTMDWVWNVSYRLINLYTQSLAVALFWKVAGSFGGRALLE